MFLRKKKTTHSYVSHIFEGFESTAPCQGIFFHQDYWWNPMTLNLKMLLQSSQCLVSVFSSLCVLLPRQARLKDLNASCFKTCSWTPWCRYWEHPMRWSSWFWGTPTSLMTCCSAWREPWRAARLRSLCSTSTSTSSAHMGLTSCSMFWEWGLRSKAYSKFQEPQAHITTAFEKEFQEKQKNSKPAWEHYSFKVLQDDFRKEPNKTEAIVKKKKTKLTHWGPRSCTIKSWPFMAELHNSSI